MSRIIRKGINPETKEQHEVAFGWDEVPGLKPGYFFQVFDNVDPDNLLVNEGFMTGISEERLRELMDQWSVPHLIPDHKMR